MRVPRRGADAKEPDKTGRRPRRRFLLVDHLVELVEKKASEIEAATREGKEPSLAAGSLERDLLERYGEPCPEAMVESALNHAKILEDNGFFEFKISCKAALTPIRIEQPPSLAHRPVVQKSRLKQRSPGLG